MIDTDNSGLLDPASRLIPLQVASLFGRPPILAGEDHRAYESLLSSLVAEIDPKDSHIMWMFVKDIADLTWEIFRLRRTQAALIDVNSKEALIAILESTIEASKIKMDSTREQQAEDMADAYFKCRGRGRSTVMKHLDQYHLDAETSIEAQAIAMRARELEMLDRMIESRERRRIAALREITAYRRSLGARLGEMSREFIEAEIDSETWGPTP